MFLWMFVVRDDFRHLDFASRASVRVDIPRFIRAYFRVTFQSCEVRRGCWIEEEKWTLLRQMLTAMAIRH